jgi:acetyl-CoA C-acetyltransferase
MIEDGLACAIAGCSMGQTAEEVASRYDVGRAEQDAFAAESQRRALAAISGGGFAREIVPVSVSGGSFHTDEHPRPGTDAASLGGLKPAFKTDGSVTAGNSSGINDGAAALVVSAESWANAEGLKPLARIVSYATAGVDPTIMGMGPVPAIRAALARAGLAVGDVDLFEINEAFAAQSLAVARELDLDPSRLNVNGGAIALGHPIGASGARILTTLIHALRARGEHRGVAALCIGGGQGIAMVVEILWTLASYELT